MHIKTHTKKQITFFIQKFVFNEYPLQNLTLHHKDTTLLSRFYYISVQN
ncbi:hypothetical protein PARMER_04219 [Parabacteroides merdae ATCC 43184]|nr:hypothetical protein PARMER_04219 [Parabacteroides merdae ATCC 43184]